MPRKTKEDQREYARKHYQENKRSYLDRNNRRRWEKRLWLIGYKDRPCHDCGLKYPYFVMDFDHRDRAEKRHELAKVVNTGSWKVLKAEIAKCDVVCANCHRKRTFRGQKLTSIPRVRGAMPDLAQRGLEVLEELHRLNDALEPSTDSDYTRAVEVQSVDET